MRFSDWCRHPERLVRDRGITPQVLSTPVHHLQHVRHSEKRPVPRLGTQRPIDSFWLPINDHQKGSGRP